MTFTPVISGVISTENSSTSPLGANETFTGTGINVRQYSTVEINIVSDVNSFPTGVSIEFSSDNTNWNIKEQFTYLISENPFFYKTTRIKALFCRIIYKTASAQSTFRLQTKFHISTQDESVIPAFMIDAFGRLRVSSPQTLLQLSHIYGKQPYDEIEIITGSATSTSDANASLIHLATTGAGSVILSSRRRGVYQPGKSLLCNITGVLNSGSNPSTVITRIGLYDNDNGYFFEYNNGILYIVERTNVTGSIVETAVAQSNWNVKKLNGTDGITLDMSKSIIFWFDIEWLGVGTVRVGVVVNGTFYLLHKFHHANIINIPYIFSASLPLRWQIISTDGAGSMRAICGTIISEGGFNPIGKVFTADTGLVTKTVNSEIPVISLRINSSFPKIMLKLINHNAVCTTTGHVLVRLWLFYDTVATSILTGSSFVSPLNSKAEYDISSTVVNTTNGRLFYSTYFSSSINQSSFLNTDDLILTYNNGISTLLVLTCQSIGQNESIVASITWDELY